MLAIAAAEFRMLARNRLVAVSALIMPVFFGIVMISLPDFSGGTSFAAATLVMSVLGLVVYVTATTTLAARRQNLFLKRMRSTAVSDWGIVGGVLAPTAVLAALQLAVILTGMVVVGDGGVAGPVVVVVAVLLALISFVGLALATAGVTNSPEHAQVTALPLFFIAIGVAAWAGIGSGFEGDDPVPGLVRSFLPGGGATQLVIGGWDGVPVAELLPSLGGAVLWAIIGLLAARRMFRWEPRV